MAGGRGVPDPQRLGHVGFRAGTNPTPLVCVNVMSLNGTMKITLTAHNDGSYTGKTDAKYTTVETSLNGPTPQCPHFSTPVETEWNPTISGSASSLSASDQTTNSQGGLNETDKLTFTGALSNGVVNGTLTITHTNSGTSNGTTVQQSFTATIPVSAR